MAAPSRRLLRMDARKPLVWRNHNHGRGLQRLKAQHLHCHAFGFQRCVGVLRNLREATFLIPRSGSDCDTVLHPASVAPIARLTAAKMARLEDLERNFGRPLLFTLLQIYGHGMRFRSRTGHVGPSASLGVGWRAIDR
jgi:hypothetical protein